MSCLNFLSMKSHEARLLVLLRSLRLVALPRLEVSPRPLALTTTGRGMGKEGPLVLTSSSLVRLGELQDRLEFLIRREGGGAGSLSRPSLSCHWYWWPVSWGE